MGKKFFMVLMTVAMVFGMSNSVNAAELSKNGDTASIPVKYTVNNTAFVITIPAVISPDTTVTTFEVEASYVNLRPDEHIEVSVKSGCDIDGKVTLKRQGVADGKQVAELATYFTTSGINIAENGFIVGVFEDSASSNSNTIGAVSMSALEVTQNTEAGDYQGLVEFEINLISDADE